MSLSNTTDRNQYTGNGTASVYSYTFPIVLATDLAVFTRVISTGVEAKLVLNTDYSIAGVGQAAGGSITLLAGALPVTTIIVLRRIRPLTQNTSIRNQTAFYASVHEDTFDNLTMLDQQLQDELSRSAKLPETFTKADFDPTLPAFGLIGQPNVALITDNTGTKFIAGPALNQSTFGITQLNGDVAAVGPGNAAAVIQPNVVDNTKAAQMATNTIKGNISGSTANAADLSVSQVTAMLNPVAGDAGSGGTKGLVPAPASGDAAAAKFLKADGSWAVPAGGGGGGSVTLTGDVTGSGTGSFATTIANNAVTNAKAGQMAANTLKGNNTGSTANSADLTATQATAMLNPLVGDSGSGGTKGLSPAPASGDAAAGKFLKADGTWAVPPGSGGGSGTVTSASVVTANGLAGTVANSTTTPAITLSTTVTGILKGNGTAISAAASGTDYALPNANTTGTAANITGTLAIANGGTGQITAPLAFGALSPLTTKGDLLSFASANARVPVGSNGQGLIADSSQTNGVRWGNPSPIANYILNGDIESGVTSPGFSLGTVTLTSNYPTGTPSFGSGASGNLALSATSSSPIDGAFSLQYASSAATTAGNFVATDAFTIGKMDQSKILTFSFGYSATAGTTNINYSGTQSNSLGIAIYDVTNSAFIIPTGCFSITQGSGTGTASGSFQTSANGTSYRLLIYNANATAGAATLLFDRFQLGPQTLISNTCIITDWVQYTPTVVGFGTVTSPNVFSRRVGGNLEVKGFFNSGTPTAVANSMTIGYNGANANVSINTSIVGNNGYAGDMTSVSSASTFYRWAAYVGSSGSTTIQFGVQSSTGNSQTANQNGSALGISNTNSVLFSFSVPIAGWASNLSILNQDNDNRVTAFLANSVTGSLTTTQAAVNFGAATNDTHAAWNGSTTYTIPVTGYYDVMGYLIATMPASYTGTAQILLFKNGSSLRSFSHWMASAAGSGNALPMYFNWGSEKFNAGDTIQIQASGNNSYPSTAWNGASLSIERVTGPATVTGTEAVNMRYTNTAGTTIPTTTAGLAFATKDFDSHGMYSGSTYTIFAQGKYLVTCKVQLAGATVTTAQAAIFIDLWKNGAIYEDTYVLGNGVVNNIPFAATFIVQCNAGDTLQIQSYTGKGTSGTLLTTAGSNSLAIAKIG